MSIGVYPSTSRILDLIQHMQALMPDLSGPGTLSLSAPTLNNLALQLKAEIISCYNEDCSAIALDKFIGDELSFTM